jgi:hypothetical protein
MLTGGPAQTGWERMDLHPPNDLEQVRRGLAEVKRARRAETRAEIVSRGLRVLGHVARPVAYLGPVVLLSLWLWPDVNASSQSFKSLAFEDILLMWCSILVFFAVGVPLALFSFNLDRRDAIDWEAWGRVGLWLFTAAAFTAVIMAYFYLPT